MRFFRLVSSLVLLAGIIDVPGVVAKTVVGQYKSVSRPQALLKKGKNEKKKAKEEEEQAKAEARSRKKERGIMPDCHAAMVETACDALALVGEMGIANAHSAEHNDNDFGDANNAVTVSD